jgi:hypothetical protein
MKYHTYQKFRDFFANNRQAAAKAHVVFAIRECPHCGENLASRIDGSTLILCGNRGKSLGLEYSKCEHLNTEPTAMYCMIYGETLTDEAIKAREGLDQITETGKQKAKRKAEERRQREAERRKRGEPGL